MKIVLLFSTVLCLALLVHADGENGEKMTDEEIQEMINGYKDTRPNTGMSEPVSYFRLRVDLGFTNFFPI